MKYEFAMIRQLQLQKSENINKPIVHFIFTKPIFARVRILLNFSIPF